MKKLVLLVALLAWVMPANAEVIATDSNDNNFGFPHLDLLQLEADSDGTDLVLTLTVAGDVLDPDWGKFLFSIDTDGVNGSGGMSQIPDGDPPTNDANPWLRNIAISNQDHLAEFFIGSWVDGGGGAQLWSFDGAAWATSGGPALAIANGTPSTLTYTMPLSDLGVGLGDTIWLEAFSSGGGSFDTAIDTVNDPSEDWNPPAGEWSAEAWVQNSTPYTIVPEPVSLALLAIGGLALIRRRR
jgi:hypothetical protein